MSDENKLDAILEALPWRCFHCDFVTSDRAEAEAHFGDQDDDSASTPICKWWASISTDEKLYQFQQTLKELEAERRENGSLRTKNDGLQYRVDIAAGEIRSYKPFRTCQSIYDVFCLYDSMEGRALAAEEALKEAEQVGKGAEKP